MSSTTLPPTVHSKYFKLVDLALDATILDQYGNVDTGKVRLHYIHKCIPIMAQHDIGTTTFCDLPSCKLDQVTGSALPQIELLSRVNTMVNGGNSGNEVLDLRLRSCPPIDICIDTHEVTTIPARRGGQFVTLVPPGRIAHYAHVKFPMFENIGIPVYVNSPVYFVNGGSKNAERGLRRLAQHVNFHPQCLSEQPPEIRGNKASMHDKDGFDGQYLDSLVYLSKDEIQKMGMAAIRSRLEGDSHFVIRASVTIEPYEHEIRPLYWKSNSKWELRDMTQSFLPRKLVQWTTTSDFILEYSPKTILAASTREH